MRRLLSIAVLLLATAAVFSQSVYDLPCRVGPKSIRAVSVATSSNVCISWPTNQYRLIIQVDRRVYTNRPSAWQNWANLYSLTNGSSAAGSYCDTTVGVGTNYEYRVSQFITNYTCSSPETDFPYWYFEHICTGTQVPLRDTRGNLVLLVESGVAASLATELSTLTNDLVGDGYKVFRHDVAAVEVTNSPIVTWAQAVTNTHNLVVADYDTDPTADWTVFIVGHVPIPYSGLNSPGGHLDNYGAHAADWYYADTNTAAWTDTTANDTSGAFAAQHNVPGDGKFDQSVLPTKPEMRIGRIDLRNMPAFVGQTETDLLRQYLNRDHAWRNNQFTVRDMALVNSNNNAGLIYRGLPADAHDIDSGFFGTTNNTILGSWLIDAASSNNSYLFAQSYGNGYYDHDLQCGYTTNFASTNFYAVFITHFGSYFGDWDSSIITNAVLQAGLASGGYTLAAYYHSEIMNVGSSAIGEPIGQELFAEENTVFTGSLNNTYLSYGIYDTNSGSTTYHGVQSSCYISLLGDPTLKQRIVAPPTNAFVQKDGADRVVYWTASTDTNIQGYHVYRAPTTNLNMYTRLTTPPTNSPYRDVAPPSGTNYTWWVRAVKLDQSTARTFYNASGAAFSPSTLYTNYYVATNGSNSNPGTSALPFLTVQKGFDVAQAGDIIYLGQGNYPALASSARNGTSSNPITLDGQGVATVMWLNLQNQYLNVINCTVSGLTNFFQGLIYMNRGAHHCLISNNIVDDTYTTNVTPMLWNGPSTIPFGTDAASDCLIISNTFTHGWAKPNIVMYGDRNVFTHNRLLDGANVDWFNIWGRSNHIVANYCSNDFEMNLEGAHPDFIQTFGSNGAGSRGHVVESNTIVHSAINGTTNLQIGILEVSGAGGEIQDWVFRNNLFIGIPRPISVLGSNISFYNNTFYNCATGSAGPVILYGSDGSGNDANGCKVMNNIFLECGNLSGTGNSTNTGWYVFATNLLGVAADYNIVSKNGFTNVLVDPLHRAVGDPGGWPTPANVAWWENHGINGGNPLLDAGYRPATNSILVGAATNLNALFLTDLAGLTRGVSWDIGAYQATGGSNPPAPPSSTNRFWAGSIRAGRVSKP